jgi:hypothetical protein
MVNIINANALQREEIEAAVRAYPFHLQMAFQDRGVKIVMADKGQQTRLMPEFQYDLTVDPFGPLKVRALSQPGANLNIPAETLRATNTILLRNDAAERHIVVHELGHIVDFMYALPNDVAPMYRYSNIPYDFFKLNLSMSEPFNRIQHLSDRFSAYEPNAAESFAEGVRMYANVPIPRTEDVHMMFTLQQALLEYTNSNTVQQGFIHQAPEFAEGLKRIFDGSVVPGENPFA